MRSYISKRINFRTTRAAIEHRPIWLWLRAADRAHVAPRAVCWICRVRAVNGATAELAAKMTACPFAIVERVTPIDQRGPIRVIEPRPITALDDGAWQERYVVATPAGVMWKRSRLQKAHILSARYFRAVDVKWRNA